MRLAAEAPQLKRCRLKTLIRRFAPPSAFLNEFQHHWPTDGDHTYVDFVRDGLGVTTRSARAVPNGVD